jgi:hypothetical protein
VTLTLWVFAEIFLKHWGMFDLSSEMIAVALHLNESIHIVQLDREKILLVGNETEVRISLRVKFRNKPRVEISFSDRAILESS